MRQKPLCMGFKYENRGFFRQPDKHYLSGNVVSSVQSGKNTADERAEILIF